MNIQNWVDQAIAQGILPNLSTPISTWDDHTVATQLLFHQEQIRRALLNIQSLEIWPEHRSELFNEATLANDIEYHQSALEWIKDEILRREIP